MDYTTIGKNIKQYRKTLGLKQDALAELAGLSTSYYGAVERGEKLPSLQTFIDLANALNVSSDTLLREVLNVRNQIAASELSEKLAALPAEEQRRILRVVETMIADSTQK